MFNKNEETIDFSEIDLKNVKVGQIQEWYEKLSAGQLEALEDEYRKQGLKTPMEDMETISDSNFSNLSKIIQFETNEIIKSANDAIRSFIPPVYNRSLLGDSSNFRDKEFGGRIFTSEIKREDLISPIQLHRTDNNKPPVDILLKEDRIAFYFGVPGVISDNIKVEFSSNLLDVSITLPSLLDIHDGGSEDQFNIWFGKYKETFSIPNQNSIGLECEVDEENIKASVKDGLVSIVVPFKERIKTKITVS